MITPIETTYKGCRFRSRLEARWAVFFDTLGVAWKYEPQGYKVNGKPYLPDFYIPQWQAFVEVKGEAERLDVNLLADLTATCRDALWTIVLGDVPYLEAGSIPMHSVLMRAFDIREEPSIATLANPAFAAINALDEDGKRDVMALLRHQQRGTVVHQRFVFMANGRNCVPLQVGPLSPYPSAADILAPETCWAVLPMREVADAYNAARMARFEHDQAPAA